MNHEETDKRFEEKFIEKHIWNTENPVLYNVDFDKIDEIKAFIHSERELAYKEGHQEGKEGRRPIEVCKKCKESPHFIPEGALISYIPDDCSKCKKAALIKKMEEKKEQMEDMQKDPDKVTDRLYYDSSATQGYINSMSDAIKIIEENL